MARKTKIVNLSLPQETYNCIAELAEQIEVSKSEILREALKQYVVSEERWRQIRYWGAETAKNMGIKNENDLDRIIHDFRQEKTEC